MKEIPEMQLYNNGEIKMIFSNEHIEKIRNGTKTQTRRQKCNYRPGRSYAVQPGRGKPELFRITILDIRRERLGDISEADCIAEGYPSRDAYREVWTSINGVWDPDQFVYVIDFR